MSDKNKEAAAKFKGEGNTFFKAKNHLKAAGMYTKAAKADPNDPVLRSNLAAALIGLSKFDKAVLAAQECIKLDPTFEKGHYRLACALQGAERFDESILAFEKTLEVNPDNKDAKKRLIVAARESLKLHMAEGTEPPEATAKFRKVRSAADIAASDARKAARMAEKSDSAKFKFAEVKEGGHRADAEDGGLSQMKIPDLGPAGKAQKAAGATAELFSTEGVGDVSAPEDIEAAMLRMKEGQELEYSSDRVTRFMMHEIGELCKPENAKSYVYPIAIFLPGTQKEGWGDDEGQGVACRSCFDSADTHKNVLPFLRSYAEKTTAHAMLMVAPKAQISFPQVWRRKDKKWPYGETGGYFVQLDARKGKDRRVWFVEVAGTAEKPEYKRHMLDDEYYTFLQPVLRPILMDMPSAPRDFAADRAQQGSNLPVASVPEEPVVAEEFSEAEGWQGAREGWHFKVGPNGCGYYKEQ